MTILTAALVGYAIGSAPISYGIVRAARGIDLRREGSGNVGATNVYRTSGAPIALAVMLVDIVKGVFSVMVAGDGPAAVAAGAAAVAGHIFPVWLGFRGGKGVATAAGAFSIVAPFVTAVCVGVFAALVAATRYVSLASILAAVTLSVGMWWFGPLPAVPGASVVTALILVAHRENIGRLVSGTERKLGG